jgi:manganese-dependent ADP-ribose/CDP-alcohol diphosphatase
MKYLLPFTLPFLLFISASCQSVDKKIFEFGAMADCQYCNKKSSGARRYSESTKKLAACVEHYNTMPLTYIVHLGDFIDAKYESFEPLNKITAKLKAPLYHVLGNHEFSVEDKYKKDIYKTLKMPAPYYDFKVKDWRFIVLNGNDISFHAHPKGSPEQRAAATYYKKNKIKSARWNGAIGPIQLKWLQEKLKTAGENKENVILYCHFPVYKDKQHKLWNAEEVLGVLDQYTCVKAWINGHNHKGGYAERKGVHYLTLKGMVDTAETSYSVIEVYRDRLEVKGYGREGNRVLKLEP